MLIAQNPSSHLRNRDDYDFLEFSLSTEGQYVPTGPWRLGGTGHRNMVPLLFLKVISRSWHFLKEEGITPFTFPSLYKQWFRHFLQGSQRTSKVEMRNGFNETLMIALIPSAIPASNFSMSLRRHQSYLWTVVTAQILYSSHIHTVYSHWLGSQSDMWSSIIRMSTHIYRNLCPFWLG